MEKTEQPKGKFPRGIPYIMTNETAERFSYYGMRGILAPFLMNTFFLQMAKNDKEMAQALTNEAFHAFVTLNYFMPFLGGILADWFLGKYRTIIGLSIVYAIGSLALAWSAGVPSLAFVNISLWLIAIGSGGIKPNVSSHLGDQFNETNQHLMSKAFTVFYLCVNIGALVSMWLTPILYDKYDATIAFGVPGILMIIANIAFWMGRNKYQRIPPSGFKRENFLAINFDAIRHGFSFKNIEDRWSEKALDGVYAVWRVMAVFAFIPVFWGLYDQSSSEWVLQADSLDCNLGLGLSMLPAQVQIVNALFVIILAPLFSWGVYPFFEKFGVKVTALKKMAAGFIFAAVSFAVIALIQEEIDLGNKPSVWWQILAYFLITIAEVLISITGLEYAYSRAPKSMKATIMAFFLLTVSIGNFAVSLINGSIADKGFFYQFSGASYYWLFCCVGATTALLFLIITPRLKDKIYVVEAET